MLSKLPLELLLRIGSCLAFEDRIRLASLSSQLRKLFIPELFSTIRATNRKEDADAIEQVAAKFTPHIRGLHFQCYLYGTPSTTDDVESRSVDQTKKSSDVGLCTLPDAAANLLSGEILEQLQAMTIEFIPDDDFIESQWEMDNSQPGVYIFEYPEPEHKMKLNEEISPWRMLMSRIWHLVSANTSTVALEVLSLPPCRISAWDCLEWKLFLSRLEKLSIVLWGGDNGAGWEANSLPGYRDFLSRLDEYFFSHCLSLVHLEVVAHKESPYGCDSSSTVSLALRSHHLPHLRNLELRNCVLDANLVTFLRAHSEALRHLSLIECNSIFEDEDLQGAVSWAEFFKAIQASRPVLESLLVKNPVVLLPGNELLGKEIDNVSDEELEDTIEYGAITSRKKKLFPYCQTWNKYGCLIEDANENLSRSEAGDDLREYNSLKSLVRHNASAVERSELSEEGLDEGNSRSWRTRRVEARTVPSLI